MQIGNSAGVVIPKQVREGVGLVVGNSVQVTRQNGDIVLKPVKSKKITGVVDVKFMRMVDEFITDHKDVLAKLAKR